MYLSLDNGGKARFWQEQLSACRESDLTVADFCRLNNLPRKSYYYWKRRLACSPATPCELAVPRSSTGGESPEAQGWLFIEAAALPTPCRRSTLTIRVSGAEIEVDDDFDPTLLRSVVQALGTQPC
jgi:hypothetical protein